MDFENFIRALKGMEEKTNIRIDDIYQRYLINKKAYTSPQTINYYVKTIEKTIMYFKSINVIYIKDLNVDVFLRFINYLKNQNSKLKNNTINKYIENFKYMLNFAVDQNIIEYNPLQKLKKLPKDDVETKIIDNNYFYQIRNYLIDLPNTKYNLRNKTFIFILMDTGIRISELKNLKVENINLKDNTIKLTYTKTRKFRTVFFTDITKKHLQKLITSESLKEYIYVSDNNPKKILNHNYIYKFLNKIKYDLNIPDDVSITCHKWRHTLATSLLNNGMNIEEVRKILGHSTITMTTRYLHVNTSILQDKYNDCINRNLKK